MDSPIQILPDGRRYLMRDGKQVFISPVAYGAAPPKDETGIFRQRPQWNQRTGKWETPIDWSNIANIGMAGALTGGIANAAMSAGPVAAGGASGAIAPGVGAYTAAPTVSGVTGAATGVGGAASAVGTGAKIADAVSSAVPAIAGLAGGAGKTDLSPEAMALIDQQRARLEQSHPLYQDVMQLAMRRMPTSASEGLAVPSYEQVSASVPEVGSGDYAEDPATRGLLRQQVIRSKMSDPVLQAVLRLARSRMPNRG